MAEPAKKTIEKPTDEPQPAAPLTRASESGDPDVHRLLAERQAHLQNVLPEDSAAAARREAAKKAIDNIDRQLADLGFVAS